ncbi:septum formation initiator family protein [Myxococcota bacterium]|nr:septum formation initiator family protein [Myxococcota bacterium]MCZ7619498.1 septum formation initiator family protein [Myxococcota bacterium]
MRALFLAVLLVVGAALWAWLDATDGVETWRRLRREVAEAQERVGQADERNAALRAEIEGLRSDPFQQERAVREELRWARPGETIVRAPRTDAVLTLPSVRRPLP